MLVVVVWRMLSEGETLDEFACARLVLIADETAT